MALGRDSGGVDSTTVVGEKGGLTKNHSLGFQGLFPISSNEWVGENEEGGGFIFI